MKALVGTQNQERALAVAFSLIQTSRRFVSSSTKAAVKALDTVTFFLTDDTAPDEIQTIGLNPTKFFVGGASKRGWTTWSTASVDSRQATSCKKRKNKQNIIPFNFQQCLFVIFTVDCAKK